MEVVCLSVSVCYGAVYRILQKKPEFFLESERCVLIVNVVFIHHQVYGEFILQITMFTGYDFYVLFIQFYVILPCLSL